MQRPLRRKRNCHAIMIACVTRPSKCIRTGAQKYASSSRLSFTHKVFLEIFILLPGCFVFHNVISARRISFTKAYNKIKLYRIVCAPPENVWNSLNRLINIKPLRTNTNIYMCVWVCVRARACIHNTSI